MNLPLRASESHGMKAIANQVALYAAMKPIQGAEFDLDEKSIEEVCAEGSAVEGRTEETRTGIVKIPPQVLGVENDSEAASVDFTEIKEHLEHDHVDSASSSTNLVHRYPSLVFPSGPLKKKSHAFVYTSLFKMAWSGEEEKAQSLMIRRRKDREVSIDLKIVSMEVVHTVNSERSQGPD